MRGILAIANQPMFNGYVYTIEALRAIAACDPRKYRIEDDKLFISLSDADFDISLNLENSNRSIAWKSTNSTPSPPSKIPLPI
jgi:hypothetical protein